MANIGLARLFVLCERLAMDIRAFRQSRGLTQDAFAALIGLKSKGHVSEIENGQTPSIRVALEIERVSEGVLKAADLNADVALVDQYRDRAA